MLRACSPFAIPTQPGGSGETSEPNPTKSFFSIPLLEGKPQPSSTYKSATPYPTRTPSRTPSPTLTQTMTLTPTLTPTPTPTLMPKLNLLFQTCDTGFDLFGGLGEITNAYITLQNIGNTDAENVKLLLSANDEEKPHQDKQYTVPFLPPQNEITLKLSVDTQSSQITVLTIQVTADNASEESFTKENCTNRFPDKERIDALGVLFKVVSISSSKK